MTLMQWARRTDGLMQIWFMARKELGWARYYYGRLAGLIEECGLQIGYGGLMRPSKKLRDRL